MKTYVDDPFFNESLDKILRLATLTLYGVNAKLAIYKAIDDIYHYLLTGKYDDPEAFLLAFKNGLMRLADSTDPCMPDYKKTLQDAALFIELKTIPC